MARAAAWIPAIAAALVASGCSNEQPDAPRARPDPQPAETADPPTSSAEVSPGEQEPPWSELAAGAAGHGLTDDVPATVTRVCAEIAERAAEQGYAQPVFCPPLVPDVAIGLELAGGLLRYRHFDAGYNIGFWSPDAELADVFGGHWSIAAGRAEALRVYTHPSPPDAPPGQPRPEPVVPPEEETTLAGVPVTLYRTPPETEGGPGFYSGHLVYEWRHGRTTFHLTMHGHDNEPQTRVMAAALIELVKACGTQAARARAPDTCRLVFGSGQP